MPTVVAVAVLDTAHLETARRPWAGLVREEAAGADRWTAAVGPTRRWERVLEVEPLGPDRHQVTQRTDYQLDLPFFAWLFALPTRRDLRRIPLRTSPPWWAPTEAFDRGAAHAVCALCILSLATGYLGTLLTQTIAFAGQEFGVGSSGQGVALAVSRVDTVIAFSGVVLADRLGRRRVLAAGALVSIACTAFGALAPSMALLIALQVPSRGLTAAMNLIIGVHAAEEVPSHARAWAASVLALINALGAGLCVMTLPLADLGTRAWRLSYVVPLLFLPLVTAALRRLAESRRFLRFQAAQAELAGGGGGVRAGGRGAEGTTQPSGTEDTTRPTDAEGTTQPSGTEDPTQPAGAEDTTQPFDAGGSGEQSGSEGRPRLRGHGGRLALLAAGGFLVAMFVNPAAQLQNTFLAEERGFSASRIALFTILTGTPAGIGVVVGGRLAERSRRVVGATGLLLGTVLVVLAYLAAGWPLWALGVAAGIFSAATIPALAVYGPELFPTGVRGRANGVISIVSRAGAVTGLLAAGLLSDRLGSLGRGLAVLAAGPLLLGVLVLTLYPETASRELEDLNPEDRPLQDTAGG